MSATTSGHLSESPSALSRKASLHNTHQLKRDVAMDGAVVGPRSTCLRAEGRAAGPALTATTTCTGGTPLWRDSCPVAAGAVLHRCLCGVHATRNERDETVKCLMPISIVARAVFGAPKLCPSRVELQSGARFRSQRSVRAAAACETPSFTCSVQRPPRGAQPCPFWSRAWPA